MKITALMTLLVLGSSTLAMAEPGVRDHRDYDGDDDDAPISQPIVRDHRDNIAPATPVYTAPQPGYVQPGYVQPGYVQSGYGWHRPIAQPVAQPPVSQSVTLASNVSFGRSTRVIINGSPYRFEKLQLKADSGRTEIRQVAIFFANGTEQVVRDVDKVLDGSNCLDIQLDGIHRQITRVV